jgi:predicted glycosyltransferase/peptidoglycan/xylan/chitin deacetylase (PgdA/CDA1 family)
MEPSELEALASYRDPDEPLVPGINVWRTDSEPSPFQVVDGDAQFALFAAVHPIEDVPPAAEVVADIYDPSGRHYSYVLWFPQDASVVLPFDSNAATQAFWREEYIPPTRRTLLPQALLSLYYLAKPLLPRAAMGSLRKVTFRRAFGPERLLDWPSDNSLDSLQRLLLRLVLLASGRSEVGFAWFWPHAHPWAVTLTHDVETADGLAYVERVAELERQRGLRSSFNLVPRDYHAPESLLRTLRDDGFEIGVHGYTHDGLMFSSQRRFMERLGPVNEYGRTWGASGFRSPATYRNWDWLRLLEFEYDSSAADTAPFEPQPGGCASFFPYLIDHLVEIPMTLPQDHTLFGLLGQSNAEQWLGNLGCVRDTNGMACVLTHPDPDTGYIGLDENEVHYRELLDVVADSDAWIALPRDVARWWHARAATPMEQVESLEGSSLGIAVLDTAGRLRIVPPARSERPDSRDIQPTGVTTTHEEPLRVWIDMANSPHVQFFGPLIRELEARGHSVLITARDYAQTTGLLDEAGLAYTKIGHHGGRSTFGKARAIYTRSRSLAAFARQHGADIAVHHNSYAQSLAARSAGIPSVTLMDYEYQPANHVSFRLSSIVVVPDSIPSHALAPYGAYWRLRRYPGLKEDFYVASMLADAHEALGIDGIDSDRPLLVLRPPPDLAAYHQFENLLWGPLLRYLSENHPANVLVLPRTKDQASRLASQVGESVVIADRAIAPAVLLSRADAVITAGGTMAREAAALGIPAYTIFAGRRGGVDTRLIAEGRLVELTSVGDFDRIRFEKRVQGGGGDLAREHKRVSWLADLVVRTAR